jgi:hypothetical protein
LVVAGEDTRPALIFATGSGIAIVTGRGTASATFEIATAGTVLAFDVTSSEIGADETAILMPATAGSGSDEAAHALRPEIFAMRETCRHEKWMGPVYGAIPVIA